MKQLALVTCAYDLVKRGHTTHRTIDGLIDNAAFVLGQDRELVIFIDPDVDLESKILALRGGRPTKILSVPLEDLLSVERATGAKKGAPPLNANKVKDAPIYVHLTWSKFAMLERALEVTAASHVGWIDFSITHVAKLPPESVDVFADPSDAPHVHVLRCFDKRDVDRADYWRHVRGHLAAGLIVGARDRIRDLSTAFWIAVDRAISMKLSPLEEGLLSYVVGQRPLDFEYSYGNYEDILRNHDAPRGGDAHRAWIVEDARSRGLSDTMNGLGRKQMYVFDPATGSTEVSGFPAVVLGYRAEGAQLIVPGRYERDLIDWARQLAPADKQFVDVGAHMGSWTLVMAAHFREVHAFEPQRLIYQQLCGNAALNGLTNVFAHNVGLDKTTGKLTLHRPGIDRGSSSAHAEVAERFKADNIALSPETICVVKLDSFADVLTDVGLMKIDVEGLELRVLKGALKILRANDLPKIIFECWSSDWFAEDKKQLLRFLETIGYRIIPISRYADVFLAEKK